MDTQINLLGLSRAALVSLMQQLGEPAYRAQQILQSIHLQGNTDIQAISTLSKSLRARLSEVATIVAPTLVSQHQSPDGTQKWLIRVDSDNIIETVYIPERTRGTLCVSSQVGCAMNCSFCATGKQGFNRNLSVAEIIGQVWMAVRALSQNNGVHDHAVTNVVMMGMGEPLDNFNPVVSAMDIMMDDFAYGLSKRRVTLSTSGLVPAMERLKEVSDVALAVSLHAPTDELRDVLVPVNRKYPLAQLMSTCQNYFPKGSRRRITIEYVMLKDVNDTDAHAYALAKLLHQYQVPSKVNLIPYNSITGADYQCSTPERIRTFQNILLAEDIFAFPRKTRGDAITGACGQLVGLVKDRTRRLERSRASERPAR